MDTPLTEPTVTPKDHFEGNTFNAASAFGAAFEKIKQGESVEFDPDKIGLGQDPLTPSANPATDPAAQTPPAPDVKPADVTPDPAAAEADLSVLENLGKTASDPIVDDPKPKEPEAPEFEKLSLPDNASKSAKDAFAKMREAARIERQQAEEYKAKVAELEKNRVDIDPAEVERLRTINAEYEKELQVTRVEATQEYKETVLQPLAKIQGAVEGIAKRYEVDGAQLIAALADPESEKLSDMVAGMNDRDRFRLYEMADQFGTVMSIRERVVNNAQEALRRIQAHRDSQIREQQTEFTKQYTKAMESTWASLSEKIPLLQKVDGDTERNAKLEAVERFARTADLSNPDPSVRSGIAIRAAVAPYLLEQLSQTQAKLKEAEAVLAKYQHATPKTGGGTSSAAVAGEKPQYDDFLSAIRGELGR